MRLKRRASEPDWEQPPRRLIQPTDLHSTAIKSCRTQDQPPAPLAFSNKDRRVISMAEYWKSTVSPTPTAPRPTTHHTLQLLALTLRSQNTGASNARSTFATQPSRRRSMKQQQNTRATSSASYGKSTAKTNARNETHNARRTKSHG